MKKSRIVSAILTFALVVTMLLGTDGVAFAKENDAVSKKITCDSAKPAGSQRSVGRTPYVSDTVNVNTMLYSDSAEAAYKSWNIAAKTYYVFQVIPKSTGLLYIDAGVTGTYGLDIGEYVEVNGDPYIQRDFYVSGGERKTGSEGIPVTKGKACYIVVVNEYSVDMQVQLRAKVYTTIQRTLSQGTSRYTTFSAKNSSNQTATTWFKVTPKTTGTMTVTLKEFGNTYSGGYVTLYNKNKSAVSDKVYYYSNNAANRVYFGVKAGTTYYLKVTNCYGSYANNYKLGIKYSVTSRIDRALGSKSSAKKLTRKAAATNTLFTATTSQSTDWYKIYVSSKRKTQININTSGIKSGTLYVTVYRGSKKVGSAQLSSYSNGDTYTITYGTTNGKANSGTYYIKVVKGTKASGKYSIRYVQ